MSKIMGGKAIATLGRKILGVVLALSLAGAPVRVWAGEQNSPGQSEPSRDLSAGQFAELDGPAGSEQTVPIGDNLIGPDGAVSGPEVPASGVRDSLFLDQAFLTEAAAKAGALRFKDDQSEAIERILAKDGRMPAEHRPRAAREIRARIDLADDFEKAFDSPAVLAFEENAVKDVSESKTFKALAGLSGAIERDDLKSLLVNLVDARVPAHMADMAPMKARLSNTLLSKIDHARSHEKEPTIHLRVAAAGKAQLMGGRLEKLLESGRVEGQLHGSVDPNEYNSTLIRVLLAAGPVRENVERLIVRTEGKQLTPPQEKRPVCGWHAVCNLAGAEYRAGMLDRGEFEVVGRVVRGEIEPGPKVYVAGQKMEVGGIDRREQVLILGEIGLTVGKVPVAVPGDDLLEFMIRTRKPVLVDINADATENHAMVVGNPFIDQNGKVWFKTYDSNNPTGTEGKISARVLGKLMFTDGIGFLPRAEAERWARRDSRLRPRQ